MILCSDIIFVSLHYTISYEFFFSVQSTLRNKGRWFRSQRKSVKATQFTR